MRHLRLTVLALLTLAVGACGFTEDPTPENIFVRVQGDVGTPVRMVYSTQFAAGQDQTGTTQVDIVRSDTVLTTLPVDTVFNISIDRRFFVEMTPMADDSIAVRARVDVDDRNLLNGQGLVFATFPWRFVYLFNQNFTSTNIDVI